MALLKHTLVHITATVSQVSISVQLARYAGHGGTCRSTLCLRLCQCRRGGRPRRKNVHGALANAHEWSPSLLSPSFVEQVS